MNKEEELFKAVRGRGGSGEVNMKEEREKDDSMKEVL